MSRSAATAPERRATPMQLALLPTAEPSTDVLLRATRVALYASLYPRQDGSRHDRNCFNRKPNASPVPCSPACQFATGVLLLLEDYADSHPRPRPDRRRGGGRAS